MTTLPQNNSPHTSVHNICTGCPKIYAAFYYERHSKHRAASEEDHAFEYAANTFLKKIKENSYAGYNFNFEYNSNDIVVKEKFHDEASLIAAWKKVYILSGGNKKQVACMAIFSHHSGGAGQSFIAGWNPDRTTEDDGDPYDEWNLTGKEARTLQVLPWIGGESFIFMANCNGDEGSDSVAKAFHDAQNVKVYYSKAYSDFSNDYKSFDRSWRLFMGNATSSNVGDIYLLAFERGSHNEKDPDVKNHGSGDRVWEGIYE